MAKATAIKKNPNSRKAKAEDSKKNNVKVLPRDSASVVQRDNSIRMEGKRLPKFNKRKGK